MPDIRVVIADDHPLVRNGISNLIERSPDIRIIGEAGNGVDALKLVEELSPDVLILDMEMPGMNGVEVAKILFRNKTNVKILALSAYDDKQYILELIESGASGYLTKEEAPDTILEAIRGIVHGEQGWVSRRVAAKLSVWMRDEENIKDRLTNREKQVLRLVVEGKTNQGIGLALGISEKTVEKYLEAIFDKLKVTSRVEAAVFAVRERLV